jgi:hypothetical protein
MPGVVQRPGPQVDTCDQRLWYLKVEGMPHSQRGIKHYAWHGIMQACMWRDDGTRSAVKQSYRRVRDGSARPRDPQLAVIPVPRQAAEPQARGWKGGERLGSWCLHNPAHLALFL